MERGKSRVTGCGHDRGQGAYPPRIIDGQRLGNHPAHRDAYDTRKFVIHDLFT